MKHFCTALFLLLLIDGVLVAQEPVITPETRVDSATLHQWLHSADPRLIAWAADFARRNHDTNIIAEMPQWLRHTALPPYGGDEWQTAQRRAVLAVLDAVIQENAEVPLSTINSVEPVFPAEAAVLISRLPLSKAGGTLDDWMLWGDPVLSRIATMMFAHDPGAGLAFWGGDDGELAFAASVVADSQAELLITVASDRAVRPLRGGAACGDYIGQPLTPGWPQVYAYQLVENDPHVNGPLVVDVGGDRIAAMRYKENEGRGICSYPQRLDPYTRHRLIAFWLGVKPEEMAWQPEEAFTIRWSGKAAYERQLGKIIESQRQKLNATVETLRQRGILIGPDEPPKLMVTVRCEITPCPLQ